MAAHAFDMSSDFVYIFDRLEQRYLSVNSRCLDILGYTPEQILRLGRRDRAKLIHPKDLARAKQHYSDQESLADGEVSVTTFRVRHLHGDYRKLRCKQKVFSRTKDGSAKCIIGLATDITDEARRRSEIKGLRAEVCRIREFERERIAVWLHDTAVQEVLGAGMLLKAMGGEESNRGASTGLSVAGRCDACWTFLPRAQLTMVRTGRAQALNRVDLLEHSIGRQKD